MFKYDSKNESKIITRLLESVLPIIDYYCICDTGSTDNTIELIETFLENIQFLEKLLKNHLRILSITVIIHYKRVII